MSCIKNEFMKDLSDLHEIVERSATIHVEYITMFEKSMNDLIRFLELSHGDLNETNPYSDWMKYYFELESQFFGETPPIATLGARLETAVKHVIRKRFPDRVPDDFSESRMQTTYAGGRMEIAIGSGKKRVFIQVKRGFDKAIWHRILQEKAVVESKGDHYLLVSPTEYTNDEIRSEIREKHLWNWIFLWKEKNRTGECYSDWMERFLRKLGELLSL